MADKKISQLTAVSTPLAGTEVLPIVQSGNTKKVTALELTGTTVDPSGNVTIPDGNLIQGTAAKGFNFTANTPAAGMTNQLLNWYEEGAWTPTDASGASLTFAAATGRYTRIGRLVTCQVFVQYPSTASGADAKIGGLPFTSAAFDQGGAWGYTNNTGADSYIVQSSATTFGPYDNVAGASRTNAQMSGSYNSLTVIYVV